MDKQLIFVVETNKKCKSDWIYIKETIDKFYNYDHAHIRFTPIYMDGKSKYKAKKKEIDSQIKKYGLERKSIVIYCVDCDNYDTCRDDIQFLENITNYCDQNKYKLIWFCKDIERVYLNKKVADKEKKKTADYFKRSELILKIDDTNLMESKYRSNASNILLILDSYLERNE